jgi:hypothetical protein
MKVIGIITKNNNIIKTKENLKKMKINSENIIIICEKNIENVKNVRFDILIIFEEIAKTKIISQIISKCKYLIINTDIKSNSELLNITDNNYVITYGFNSKSTITVISNENDEIILGIQRKLESLTGNSIEIQEIKIIRKLEKNSIYDEISFTILNLLIKNKVIM